MLTKTLSLVLLIQVIKIKSEKCITLTNEEGNCVSLYTCPKLLSFLAKQPKNGEEYLRKSRCGLTPTEPLVCCPPVATTTKNCITPNKKEGQCTLLTACPELLNLLLTQKADSIEYVRKSGCGITNSEVSVCCPSGPPSKQNEDITQAKADLLPSRKYCGLQHSDDYGSQGQGTVITEFPWLAALYKLENGIEIAYCHGTIINERYILTSAHCVEPRSDKPLKTIRLGEYNIRNSTDCVEDSDGITECSDPVQEYGVEEITVHSNFKPFSFFFEFDIALIRVNKTIEYSEYIRAICLPAAGTELSKVEDTLIRSAWGTTYTGIELEVKKKTSHKLISNEKCTKIIENRLQPPPSKFYIKDTLMCTQALPDDTEYSCSGDSGGPVMFSYKSQWYIEGVSSVRAGPCGSTFPEIHIKVSKFLDWILANIKQ